MKETAITRKTKPVLTDHRTLLDIIINDVSLRFYRETRVTFDSGIITRYVIHVRYRRGRGWFSVQRLYPDYRFREALLEVNRISQHEIQRASVAVM